MKKIDLEIFDISHSGTNSGAYAMVLVEKGGNRKIPIIIGSSEAQAIAIELENMKPSRPLTHDLYKNTLTSFNMTVTEVLIYNYNEGIFFAKVIVTDGERIIEIDSRSSDAVAIAVRFRIPIKCDETILQTMGIDPSEDSTSEDELDEDGEIVFDAVVEDEEKPSKKINKAEELKELRDKLNQAIENEEYEAASMLKIAIEKLESEK
jgi:bifunctional DNase/RNase|tara:strand:+ start:433 stop:1053 length:621 start_codon:yes stop_codon:yes gene_type:complete